MEFNSILFLVFFTIVFFSYWFLFSGNNTTQNFLLFVSSLVFYAFWDYRFLSLILFSTIIDYLISIELSKQSVLKIKKILLGISLLSNLGLLFIFKYFNFFVDSFNTILNSFGFEKNILLINIILPVGISFYTFQTMSYTIDVYNGKIKPSNNWLEFSTYVTFFPQLVAGPIERASNMLPQFRLRRVFNYEKANEGLRKLLVGFFKKIVIADSLAPIVENIFNNYNEFSSLVLLMGLLFFSFQIYCDFSGYSDIAIGLAKLFGIDLMENFNYPYFASSIGDFWKRWHISLTTWFRDYLYIPLGGSKFSFLLSLRNISIVFILSGFWHGANWTFIFWGLVHVLFYIPYFINKKYPSSRISFFFNIKNKLFSTFLTFLIVMLSWVFFRSQTITDAWNYIFRIFSFENSQVNIINPANNLNAYYYLLYIIIFILLEKYISMNKNETQFKRRLINLSLVIVTLFFIQMNSSDSFIYFQF